MNGKKNSLKSFKSHINAGFTVAIFKSQNLNVVEEDKFIFHFIFLIFHSFKWAFVFQISDLTQNVLREGIFCGFGENS